MFTRSPRVRPVANAARLPATWRQQAPKTAVLSPRTWAPSFKPWAALPRLFATAAASTNAKPWEVGSHEVSARDSRTSTVKELWDRRIKAKAAEEEALKAEASAETVANAGPAAAPAPTFLLNKTPRDSWVELSMPFSTDPHLREQYVNYHGGVRFGKILEDLDAAAGNIAHLHAEDNNPKTRPLTIVTASVDRIDLLNNSMEVRIDVECQNPETKAWDPLVLAGFTMVALCDGKPVQINRLVPETEDENRLFAHGEQNKINRKEFSKRSLYVKPPTVEEVQALHDVFLLVSKSKGNKTQTGTELVRMSETKLQTSVICHPQQRNMAGKIFGGWLLRMAHELAWTNAHAFCGVRPFFLALDSVSFDRPVELGSILFFNSEIIYTEGHAVCVKVVAEVLNTTDGGRSKTNSFYFTFTSPDRTFNKAVVPHTYEESIRYIDGKRRYDEGKKLATTMCSRLLKFY